MVAIETEKENQEFAQNQDEESNDYSSFVNLLDKYIPKPLERGQIITGEVLKIEDNVILANVDAKRTAVIPPEDIEKLEEEYLNSLNVGDEVLLSVLHTPVGDEDLLVSLNRGLQQQDWQRAKEFLANEELLELEVVGHNKGGLLVAFGQLQGFVPTSHVPELQNFHDQRALTAKRAKFVGEELNLKVIEVDRQRRRLVLSAKKAQKERRQNRLMELKVMEGQTITGRVSNLVAFGAFIDLDGIEGLVHISEIDWQKVDNPADYLTAGEEIELLIQSVDIDRERVSLSRKAMLSSPWQAFADSHSDGELIEGVVTNVTDFGAFVTLEEGIEGLIHVSEMRGTQDFSPQDVLAPGDIILVHILNIDVDRQRMALSQRRVSQQEEMDWIWQKQQAMVEFEEAIDEEE